MVRKDETTETVKKGIDGGETSPPSSFRRFNIAERKLKGQSGPQRRKESYDSPFTITGHSALDLDVVSGILIAEAVGSGEFRNKCIKDDDNVIPIYNALINDLKKSGATKKRIAELVSEESIVKRCGLIITELYRMFPDVDCIGFKDESDEVGIRYYTVYPADLEYGTAQLKFLPILKQTNKKLYKLFLMALNVMQGRVNVINDDHDYYWEAAADYACERAEEIKCAKCKGKEIDETDLEDLKSIKESIRINSPNGIIEKTRKEISAVKGSFAEALESFKPKDKFEQEAMKFFRLVAELEPLRTSLYQYSTLVYGHEDLDNGQPALPYQVMQFIWDNEDWIWSEVNTYIDNDMNNVGLMDPMAVYNMKALRTANKQEERRNVDLLTKTMQMANIVCWYFVENLKPPKKKKKNEHRQQRVQTSSQLSCF